MGNSLIYSDNGNVDWKLSYPMLEGELSVDWHKRLHSLRSHYAYEASKGNPRRTIRRKEKHKEWLQNNKEQISKHNKNNYDKDRALMLWRAARDRARTRGLEFSLKLERVRDVISSGRCEVTGLVFNLHTKKGPYSPSIDRRDTTKGYTDDNVDIVCWGFNAAKNRFPMADVIRISQAVCDRFIKPSSPEDEIILQGIQKATQSCHGAAVKSGWWKDLKTGAPIQRNKGELLMLMVSELAEAMEGERKNLMDDKLPHRKMAEVELADCVIRVLDFAGGFGYDLGGALVEKMKYNANRRDHTHEARLEAGGKKF